MHTINERVALVMIPYLRPDFPPLSLALLKGILNYEKIPNTTIDLNIYIKDHFNSEELADLENFCSESICMDQKKTIKNIRKFFRFYIEKVLVPFQPTVVGLSLFSFFMQRTSELFALELRRYFPDVKIWVILCFPVVRIIDNDDQGPLHEEIMLHQKIYCIY